MLVIKGQSRAKESWIVDWCIADHLTHQPTCYQCLSMTAKKNSFEGNMVIVQNIIRPIKIGSSKRWQLYHGRYESIQLHTDQCTQDVKAEALTGQQPANDEAGGKKIQGESTT